MPGSEPAQGLSEGVAASFQAWGTLPASPVDGQVVVMNDIPFALSYDLSASVWRAYHDPFDLYFFYDRSYLSASITLEVGGDTTLPTADATSLQSGATWTITDSVGEIDYQASSGTSVIYWDFGAARSECLIVLGGIHPGDETTTHGFGLQTSTTHGADIDDGYLGNIGNNSANDNATLSESTTGSFTTLDTIRGYTFIGGSGAGGESSTIAYALYYKDSTGEITFFARRGSEQWVEIGTATDSTHTTMQAMFMRSSTVANNGFVRVCCPLLAFTG